MAAPQRLPFPRTMAGALLGKCVLSAACKAIWAIPHQSSPEMDLGLRYIANANFIDRAAVPFACHDDLLLRAEVEGKTPADYSDDPSGVKGLAKIFSISLQRRGRTRWW